MTLNNYVIKESKFNNPKIKEFIDCVFSSTDNASIDRCGSYLPPKFTIQSGGDMRCSGKSEVLHSMFPTRLHDIDEEEASMRGLNIESKVSSPFARPDDNTLVIYVKRDTEEKLKCLLKFRAPYTKDNEDIDRHNATLPNELKHEAYYDTERMRKEMLPSIYEHKNYMLLENKNKEEEPFITKRKICVVSNVKLENLKEDLMTAIESHDRIIRKESVVEGTTHFWHYISKAEKQISYLSEYEDSCHFSGKMKKVNSILNDLRNRIE